MSKRCAVLCGGLQSSGSSLISWCFLQRGDTDGVFDANGDMIFRFGGTSAPLFWYKTTISGFRLCEQITCAEDEGFEVRPLLVARDVRVLWASLAGKTYGRNGTTAEDPPLRVRMRRFLEDWQTFREQGWPIMRYESFVTDPELTLRKTCEDLSIPWDDAMLRWPKPPTDIANTVHGNDTFLDSRNDDLFATLRPEAVNRINGTIPEEDLAWLEKTFAAFNQASDYPAHRDVPAEAVKRAVPRFNVTRRFHWRLHQKPVRFLLHRLGLQKTIREPGVPRGG